MKTTKDIITYLQDKVLNDVLPTHQKSIIQFYLRQIQSFNDVMADLGLFGLMQDILEMYKVIPRNKKGPPPKGEIKPKPRTPAPAKVPEKQIDEGPEIVELDPDKKYNFRAEFTGGYIDPFSGTAPGPEGNKPKNDPHEGSGGQEDCVIYFDMKTGTIGKIPRGDCASKGLIVLQNDEGEEVMQGQIEDDDEREKLIWDMKKAMKNKKGDRSASKSPGPNRKKYVITPRKDATGRTIRSKSGEDALKKMQAPALDKENNEIPPSPNKDNAAVRRSSVTKKLTTATQPPKRPSLQKKEPAENAPARRSSGQKAATSKRPSIQNVVKDPKPSNDGWSNAATMAAVRRSN